MLQWTRELPIDGEPADMLALIEDNARWVEHSPQVPKLLLTFEGAPLSRGARIAAWTANPPPGLSVLECGVAGHHSPEDRPHEIAQAIQQITSARGREPAQSL
jgi:haloalkane dehalogenase